MYDVSYECVAIDRSSTLEFARHERGAFVDMTMIWLSDFLETPRHRLAGGADRVKHGDIHYMVKILDTFEASQESVPIWEACFLSEVCRPNAKI